MTSAPGTVLAHLEDEDGMFDDDFPSQPELAEEQSLCAGQQNSLADTFTNTVANSIKVGMKSDVKADVGRGLSLAQEVILTCEGQRLA